MSEDASATYRGFRNQALYVVYRLLTDKGEGEWIYRPEGEEDLAIFDSRMQLVEAVQVKDYANDLALSHFKPKSSATFFSRLKRRKHEYPNCTTKLASFGPLGEEFSGALSGDLKHRANFVRKLCESNAAISPDEAKAMLDALDGNVIHPVAADLLTSVREALRETNVAGDLEHSVELLIFWVFEASEKRQDLTRQSLLLKLERIGGYLAVLRDATLEWGTSISAVRSMVFTLDESATFIAEYRKGVQARWEHIVAGADCSRPGRLQEIHRELQHHPVVVIRGASGQGKSTLGWRYLHDFCAEGLRFHVRLVEGREHAVRIANALSSHVRRLNLKAVAYLDVSPADAGWSELVRELVASGLKVLIAVREEDFRRANVAVGDFNYSEVVLDRVTKEEAEPIFSALRTASPSHPLDFEETWTRFSMEEGGPLLEFTHLVSEGESLDSRISTQIRRIQNDAVANANGLTQAHLDLLALAAVANETGARLSLAKLCQEAGVNPLTGPLKVLENEYLVRVQHDGGDISVAGLHALRSAAVASALFKDAPRGWVEYAVRVLSLILDQDIESFLLSAFSGKPEFADALIEHLHRLPPQSWTHAGGIVRSLVWEGLSRYERRNRDAIVATMTKYEGAWWFVCDAFVGMDENPHRELLQTVNSVFKADVQAVSLTPKCEIYDPLVTWATAAPAPPPPRGPREWAAAGDVSHWLGHSNIGGPLRIGIEKLLPSPLPPELNVQELGTFISGRSRLGDAAFSTWHDTERGEIIKKFVRETDSVHVIDDGREVKVFFSVPLADSATAGMPDAHDWNEQAMKRVRLLRLLFPNRVVFGSQGLGLEFFAEQLPHDPTFKQIPAGSLPLERVARLNAMFANLVAYRHSRPRTWHEYAMAVLAFREAVSECFRKLHRGWAKLLSESLPRPNTIKQMPGADIDRVKRLSKLPMFPQSAVDEWGFLSEERQEKNKPIETMQERSLRRFDPWRKAFQNFESSIGMAVSKILDLTLLYLAEHKGHVRTEEDDKTGRLFLANLSSAWESLSAMQREYRTRFGSLLGQDRLEQLEAYERTNFRHMWVVAFAMCYERQRHLPDIIQIGLCEIGRRRARFLQTVKTEVSIAFGASGTAVVRDKPWVFDQTTHLCIICDYLTIDSFETVMPKVFDAVRRAAQIDGWRPLESKPLENEWQAIALVNLVQGKALLPACATVPTSIVLNPPDGFDANLYRFWSFPMNVEDFRDGSFTVWESPLLRSVWLLKDNVLAFVSTSIRFYQLAKLILEQHLKPDDSDRILSRFGSELKTVLTEAQRSYSMLIDILTASVAPGKARWQQELHRVCRTLLFEVDEDVPITLTLETFTQWMKDGQIVIADFRTLIFEILRYSLALGNETEAPDTGAHGLAVSRAVQPDIEPGGK